MGIIDSLFANMNEKDLISSEIKILDLKLKKK